MDEIKFSSDNLTLEDVERLQKSCKFLREQFEKASQTFEELYSFLKSVYDPSNDN